jgi:hypothetical protein
MLDAFDFKGLSCLSLNFTPRGEGNQNGLEGEARNLIGGRWGRPLRLFAQDLVGVEIIEGK